MIAGRDWSEVVEEAVRRHVASTGDPVFTRQELIDAEMDRIVSETGSDGETPHMTLSREFSSCVTQVRWSLSMIVGCTN